MSEALQLATARRFLFDERVVMRDGVELSADVYLPSGKGRYPAIIERTPYDNANPVVVASAGFFSSRGYAYVAQDVRGRGDSAGHFIPFEQEGPDGFDTIEWVAKQDWCNGRVAMMGGSYAAYVQWVAARERPPHLVTMVSTATSGRWVQEPQLHGKLRPYMFIWLHRVRGNTMQPVAPTSDGEQLLDWWGIVSTRPYGEIDRALGRENPIWREWLSNAANPHYWERLSAFHSFDKIQLPVLHITGWYDGSAAGELQTFEHMRAATAADDQYLVVGPWDHAGTRAPQRSLGGLDFGESAVIDVQALHLQWFDHWLKDVENGQQNEPRVRIFTIGRNEWRSDSWPPRDSHEMGYYLGSGRDSSASGLLVTQPGEENAFNEFVYDPEDPTPSTADRNAFLVSDASLDHGYVESRSDVLTYTSAPLVDPLEVTGIPAVLLYAASSAADTDFAAALCDVHPDGTSVLVAEGLIRTSYRAGDGSREQIEPNTVATYRIELNPTSTEFQPGHRIRLCIASASFPAYDRNPNTGRAIGDDAEIQVAQQRIHHGGNTASRLILPVVAREQ